MSSFCTTAVHGGIKGSDAHGALRTPVYDSVAFEHDSARSIQLSFEGKKPAHVYSRMTNPTVQDFEQKISQLTGAAGALAVASGMAAISNVVLTLAGAGTNIVTTRRLFGNTYSLFAQTLAAWGLETRFVPMTDPEAVEQAIDADTRAIYLESITNPQLEVADCEQISRIARRRGVPLIMDNTLLTPYAFNTRKAGIDIEVLSTTKYISGGATSLGGIIIDNGTFDWRLSPKLAEQATAFGPMTFLAVMRREVFRNFGACMAPHNAYLQNLGIETMGLRIDRSFANAQALAEFLADHPAVASVHYPGLPSSPYHEVANRQFGGRFGGILTFNLKDQEACFTCVDKLQLVRRATNVNDNKTLILHPASTIFAEYGAEEKKAMGVHPAMLRLAVGIEDPRDLIDDLQQGLESL